MSFISEFSYPVISQRKIIHFNTFVTFIVLSLLYTNLIIKFNFYFLYQPVTYIILVLGLLGIFSGNLIGRLLLNKTDKCRIIYICSDASFVILAGALIITQLISKEDIYLKIFLRSHALLSVLIFLIAIPVGIKCNFFLKISCGDFIDGKRGVIPWLIFIIGGIVSGIIASFIINYFESGNFIYSILLFIIPSIPIIKLNYNPSPIYARESGNQAESGDTHIKRDDLFFIYLNFSYIIIYLFLALQSYIKIYGDLFNVKIFFLFSIMFFLGMGFLIGKFFKNAFWFIYTEMLYPVFFLLGIVLIYDLEGLDFVNGSLLFAPLGMFLGFSLYQTINNILNSFNHKERFNILDFSVFIIPAPIIISLCSVNFTYLWYFLLFYLLAILNVIFPGIFLMQMNINGYKKIIYFIFSLCFIPLVIVIHLYFNIGLSNKLYVEYSKGFEKINNINYNAEFINESTSVYVNKAEIFHADASDIKNLKRSLMCLFLFFNKDIKIQDALFIDGNQKFFKNTVLNYYKEAEIIDTVPDRFVDFQKLSLSGNIEYVSRYSDILLYFSGDKKHSMIVDMPNLYDQNLYAFRFSTDYYNILKKHITDQGYFVQVYNLSKCRNELLSSAIYNIKKLFKESVCFLYSNCIVVISTDNSPLLFTDDNFVSFNKFFYSDANFTKLFYSDYHCFSHFLFTEIDDLIVYIDKKMPSPYLSAADIQPYSADKNLIENYINNNDRIFKIADNKNIYSLQIKQQLRNENILLSKLKEAELLLNAKEYEKEAQLSLELLRSAEYKFNLRTYLLNAISEKEKYYYYKAQQYEKAKNWEDAKKLYKAILIFNKNNFDANYRLGILSLTLQDLGEAFEYLQTAMNLNRDDPKVIYQMGVLLFSSGKLNEALNYFKKAMELKEDTPQINLYVGLCYEEIGNYIEAKTFYKKAEFKDPNDINILSSVERINDKIKIKDGSLNGPDKVSSQTEAEQGEDMPLPVTDSAKDVRIQVESGKPKTEQDQ